MKMILIECIVLCLLVSIAVIAGTKKNPLSGLHNLPLKIQQRIASMKEYSSVRILTVRERIIKKLPALAVVFGLFCWLVYLAGARTFKDGFCYALILWMAVKLYVVLVLNCLWYAHHPQYWIKGTEDLSAEYQNYSFYIRSIPRSFCAGVLVALLIGFVVMLV